MIITSSLIAAFAIATIVPLVVLFVIRKFDLYATGSFWTLVSCFVWGWIAFGLALLVNQTMLDNEIVTEDVFRWYTAPVVEEILKSLFLLYLIRRPQFNYFVDGAIYGFAAGIGFAIVENYYYIGSHSNAALGIAIARVLSTNLVHASGSALIGVMLGLARFERFPKALRWAIPGYALAMALHIGFNIMVTTTTSGLLLLYAAAMGIGAGVIISILIRRGLSHEKKFIEEMIGQETTVTAGESAIVNRLDESNKILAPLSRRFGKKKADQVVRFLTLQAQLGIKRKMVEKLPDPKMRAGVETEMAEIRIEMDEVRRAVGMYVMMYVRSIFPEGGSPVFGRLETLLTERAAQPSTSTTNTFALLSGKLSGVMPKATDEPGEPHG